VSKRSLIENHQTEENYRYAAIDTKKGLIDNSIRHYHPKRPSVQ
jgi:hypothetical protein